MSDGYGPDVLALPKDIIDEHTYFTETKLSSGQKATFYLDWRDAMVCQRCRGRIIALFAAWVEEPPRTVPRGTPPNIILSGMFGAMLGSALTGLGYRVVVLTNKEHGRQVVGSINDLVRGTPVVILDDVITTGASFQKMRDFAVENNW